MASKGRVVRIILAVVWLLLTTALIVWWMRFALHLIAKYDADSARFRTMLLWEGATLLVLLIAGGGTLIYFINREANQAHRLRDFLARFSHDVKTALAGVRLQAESLKADNRDKDLNYLIDRLATDTSRLQNQVENSLFVGGAESLSLFAEDLDLLALIEILRDSWPRLNIICQGNAVLKADRRSVESILNNVFHNALVHGQASEITIAMTQLSGGLVELRVVDNGSGFKGDVKKLGEVFYRSNSQSGSGLGLYTVKNYLARQGGRLQFLDLASGFALSLVLPGRVIDGRVGTERIP